MSIAQVRLGAASAAAALAVCSLAAFSGLPSRAADVSGDGTCGSVRIGLQATTSKDAWAAQTCFSKAFAKCDPATLFVSFGGVDSGVRRTFTTLTSNFDGTCQVVDVVEHYRVPNYSQSDTYLCSSVSQTSDGLIFTRCGADGDVMVPTDPSSPKAAAFNH
ncbi:MAG TPA: hypothetical protein VN934_04500 [Candidatus Tumulicola sp.]|jgi:hypothetical protein|nr:hypothetical protein [Candidatus Tumulicola sp.]